MGAALGAGAAGAAAGGRCWGRSSSSCPSSPTPAPPGRLAAGGDTFDWYFDDTLIGQGPLGADVVLLVVPELNVATMPGINTNEFATLAPNLQANALQYADVPAPVEVTTPIPEGVDVTSTMRASSGWCPRAQAITLL